MASSDALLAPVKGSAFRMPVGPFFATDGTVITGWTSADSEISKDGGNFTDCTNEATEIQTSGLGYLDLDTGETNCNAFWVKITISNTDAVPFVAYFVTQRAGAYLRSDLYELLGTPYTAGSIPAAVAGASGGLFISGDNTGNVTVSGTVDIGGALIIDGGLSVNGTAGFSSISTGDVVMQSLSTANYLSIGSNLSIAGDWQVNGDTIFNGVAFGSATFDQVTIGNDLTVVGTSTLNLATDTITAASVSAGAVTKIQTGLATSSAQTTAQTALTKIQAAVYDSATLSGSTLTLSNAATMVVSTTGRVTT